MMTAKVRVLRAVTHQEVDRVPIGLFGTHLDYEERLTAYVGANCREAMYRQLGIDLWHCDSCLYYTGEPYTYGGLPCDRWGRNEAHLMPCAEMSSVDEVEAYPWPTTDGYSAERLVREIALHQEFAIVGGINAAIFHHYLAVCGQENALMFLATQPAVAHAIIRHITDFFDSYIRVVLEAGRGQIDIIENCNDFGTQRSMFISADMFRKFFRPALQQLYDTTKSYDVKVMQHSCGAICPIIPDFIAMGADILNPIQVTADGMAIEEVAAAFRGQITFYGGIDTQQLLPNGQVEAIQSEVRKVLALFGTGGGYILAGSQGLMDDIPLSHAVAMCEAAC